MLYALRARYVLRLCVESCVQRGMNMSEEEEMFMINDDVSFGPSDFGKSIRMERKPGAAGDRFRELLLKTVLLPS